MQAQAVPNLSSSRVWNGRCSCCSHGSPQGQLNHLFFLWQLTKNTYCFFCIKLCTYHKWFGRPSNLGFEPKYELPMGISKLRALVQLRLGSHTLSIEQGRFARLAVPRHLRRCTVCDTQAVGDELHCVLGCPHFSDIRAQLPGLFQDAAGCMCECIGHKDQKAVCHRLIALLQKAQT